MGQVRSYRAVNGLLAILLVTPLLAFVPVAAAADPSLRVVNANTGASYATVQAALSAASAGDTITVPMGLDVSTPAVYTGPFTISTPGITLCATVAVATCVDHVSAARWSTSTGTWGTPPVAWQGAAINVGALGSTSYFPTSQSPLAGGVVQIEDITALSFDFLLAAGTCTSGGLRAQIGLNSTGEGTTKDRTVFVYTSSVCTVGQWSHRELLAGNNWGAGALGGPSAGASQAQVQALAGPAHRVVSFNAIFDGSPAGTVGWFDNVRINAAFYREQVDGACFDAESPSCTDADARASTVLDAAGSAPTTVTITAAGVTVKGFTIQNSGLAGVGSGVKTTAANTVIENNNILGNAAQAFVGAQQIGLVATGAGSVIIRGNTISNWAHSGIYSSTDSLGSRLIQDNVITTQGVNAILLEGSTASARVDILGNDLRQARNANVRINTTSDVHIHENVFGVSQFTLDLFRFGYTGVTIDATYNHWGAFSRSDIESSIGDLALATVDVSCYYLANDVDTVCAPTADFTYAPSSTHINTPVAFTDATVNGGNTVTTRAWNFGDGATSSAQNPSHPYAHNGVYTVTLVATDSEGFSSSVSKVVSVANVAPVLDAIGARSGSEGSSLAFIVQGTDVDGDSLRYTMTGAPAGATLQLSTGAFSWTPTYVQSGAYPVTFTTTDGDLSDSETIVITIADVDQPPTIGAIANPTILAGATGVTNVFASDGDGDVVTLAATGVPAYGVFTDLGGGAGRFNWAPTASDAGATTVTLVATANGVPVTRTFTVTVVGHVSVLLVQNGPALLHVSPGAITLSATVTNNGSATDTFRLRTNAPASWNVTNPADVTLAPGASAIVSVTLITPENAPVRAITLTATSLTSSSVSKSVGWTMIQPVVVTITPAQSSFLVREEVKGVVKVTYLDGSPAAGMNVVLTQTPGTSTELRSSVTGVTDSSGEMQFRFDLDLRSRLPGGHGLEALIKKPEPYYGYASYSVS